MTPTLETKTMMKKAMSSVMSNGIHIKPATIIALGVLGFVVLPSAWAGFKLGQATAGPDEKPKTFADSLKSSFKKARKKAGL